MLAGLGFKQFAYDWLGGEKDAATFDAESTAAKRGDRHRGLAVSHRARRSSGEGSVGELQAPSHSAAAVGAAFFCLSIEAALAKTMGCHVGARSAEKSSRRSRLKSSPSSS